MAWVITQGSGVAIAHRLGARAALAACGIAASMALGSPANAQDRTRLPNTGITVGEVSIEAGRLSIVGRTPAPR